MDILNLFIGAAVGFAGGYVVKGQASKSESLSNADKQYSILYNEALQELNKLKSELRSKDLKIEDMNQRIKSLTRKIRDKEDDNLDRADNLADMKRTIESLRRENTDLQDKLKDYKTLYESAKEEIDKLKS